MKQKQRRFALERNEVISEEVDRLLATRFIDELKYPDWVLNVVVVRKKNGKLHICVDFTNLNKSCPKDSYSLPMIDEVVDATAGFERMSFLDAYSRYNQILMDLSEVYIDDMVVKSKKAGSHLQDLEECFRII